LAMSVWAAAADTRVQQLCICSRLMSFKCVTAAPSTCVLLYSLQSSAVMTVLAAPAAAPHLTHASTHPLPSMPTSNLQVVFYHH
jgi:hypothetical protein